MPNGTYIKWEKAWKHPVLINSSHFKADSSRLDFSSIVFHGILQPYLHTYNKVKHRETCLFTYCLSLNVSISFMLPCFFTLGCPKHHWIWLLQVYSTSVWATQPLHRLGQNRTEQILWFVLAHFLWECLLPWAPGERQQSKDECQTFWDVNFYLKRLHIIVLQCRTLFFL